METKHAITAEETQAPPPRTKAEDGRAVAAYVTRGSITARPGIYSLATPNTWRSMMRRNLGGKDHTVRLVIAGACVAMGIFAKRGWLRALGFSIGGTELATAITRFSPLNAVLHRSTAA